MREEGLREVLDMGIRELIKKEFGGLAMECVAPNYSLPERIKRAGVGMMKF